MNDYLQMPTTVEELEAAIQDMTSQANSILCLNHNILEEYESRQRKVRLSWFAIKLWLVNSYYNVVLLIMVYMQIEALKNKQEADEKELSSRLDEINSLKVKSWSLIKILFVIPLFHQYYLNSRSNLQIFVASPPPTHPSTHTKKIKEKYK